MHYSSNAAQQSIQSSQPRMKMEAGESMTTVQSRIRRAGSPFLHRPTSQYNSVSQATQAAYSSRPRLSSKAKAQNCVESKTDVLQEASEQLLGADAKVSIHTDDKQELIDLLTQPPIVLDASRQECEDYIQDNPWPFNELRKGTLLGRGGLSVVWLATDASNNQVAVKQVARRGQQYQGEIESAKSEIMVAELLSQTDFHHQGHEYIAAILRAVETRRGVWIVQEYGGIPLSKLSFETTGVSHNGGRIYDVKHLPFLQILQRDDRVMRKLLKQILLVLDLLTMINIVHSDIKPDNILVGLSNDEELRIRICDFGSAFIFNQEKEQRPFATPEYMPPEALKANCFSSISSISRRNVRSDPVDDRGYPWSFDIWSAGCIWLEILHGVPLWIPFDCRLPSRRIVKGGLFGVKRRDPARIVANQEAVLKDLPIIWKRAHRLCEGPPGGPPGNAPLWGGGRETQDDRTVSVSTTAAAAPVGGGLTLIKRMLAVNPTQRISPKEAISCLS